MSKWCTFKIFIDRLKLPLKMFVVVYSNTDLQKYSSRTIHLCQNQVLLMIDKNWYAVSLIEHSSVFIYHLCFCLLPVHTLWSFLFSYWICVSIFITPCKAIGMLYLSYSLKLFWYLFSTTLTSQINLSNLLWEAPGSFLHSNLWSI